MFVIKTYKKTKTNKIKLAIITYPYPEEFLNRRSELVTKCRYDNKFLLKNFNSNDLSSLLKNFNSNNR